MLLADGNDLNPTMIIRCQAYLARSRHEAHDPVFAPWHALAALAGRATSPPRPPSLVQRLIAEPDADRPINPLVAGAFAGKPLSDAGRRGRAIYGELLAGADELWQQMLTEASGRPAAASRAGRRRAAKRCGRCSMRPDGAGRCSPRSTTRRAGAAARSPVAGSSQQAAQGRRGLARQRPGGAAAGHGAGRPADAGRAARLPARQSRTTRATTVPRQFLDVLAGAEPQAVQQGQRPARAGPGDRRPRQSADGPRAGQPRLAAPLRRGPGRARPATSACAATRRPIPSCSTTWPRIFMRAAAGRSRQLHRQIMLSAAYQQAQRRPARVPRRRPGEPSALADEPPPARLRGDARLRCWPSPAGSTRRSAARRVKTISEPAVHAPHALRLHRPPEPAGPLPHLRLRQPRRDQPASAYVTTVPQQALFLMNSPLRRARRGTCSRRPDVAGRSRTLRRRSRGCIDDRCSAAPPTARSRPAGRRSS